MPPPPPSAHPEEYTRLILARDSEGLLRLLTDTAVEQRVVERVRLKAATFGQDITEPVAVAAGAGVGGGSSSSGGSSAVAGSALENGELGAKTKFTGPNSPDLHSLGLIIFT